MSQALQGKVATFTSGSLAPDHFWNGIPIEADGSLAIDSGNDIDHFSQGLPMTAVGRLATAVDGIVDHYGAGATPITASGRLAFTVGGAPVSFLAAVGYTAIGQVDLAPI